MSRMETINGYSIKNCIYAGYTQHAALLFRGTPFEIIGDERIALENGFTLQEYFNQERNITPGSVCSSVFDSTLLNFDGALTGFNYERNFMLMLGVEADQGTPYSSMPSGYTERIVVNNITFCVKNNYYMYVGSDSQYMAQDLNYRHMFAIKGKETNATYYVYIVSDNGTNKYIDKIYKVLPGDGLLDQVSLVSDTDITISDYFFARLEVLANQGACECWSESNYHQLVCEKFVSNSATSVVKHTILYENMCMLTGKQPKRTLGKIIQFSAIGTSSKLDVDADSYANTEFSSSKTLSQIRGDLIEGVGLGYYYNMAGGSQVFTENPFMGMKGYTYRELLSLVGESVGRSLRESLRYTLIRFDSNNIPTYILPYSYYDFTASFGNRAVNNMYIFNRNEYYSYDAEEYSVSPIDVIISKQAEEDLGTSYPDSPAGTNTLYLLNNPLLNASDVSTIKSRLSYAFASLTGNGSGNYKPAVIECPSRLTIEPGDVVKLFLEDGSYVWTPVFTMTTTWNGSAECTMECTGDKILSQYTQKDFRKTIKDGAKVHELIVDIGQVYSRITDTLTNDYSTTQQTSAMISTQIGNALGDYYTKTETAQQISTSIGNALGDYSTTQQTAQQISAYVSNNAYEKVSGITINSDGVTVTGSKYIKLATSGYINLGDAGRVDGFGLRLKVSEDLNLYMRLGSIVSVSTNDVLGIGYENFRDNVDGLSKPSITIRTKKSSSAADVARRLNIYSASNPDASYDLITIAPWEHGQLGSSNRSYTGGRAWDYIYGNTINYVSLVQNSSRDIKHDISPLEDVGSLIDQLIPVSFVYNQDAQEKKHMGLIYEDTVGVLPGVCEGIESTDVERKTINYIELVPILLKEIQSLRRRVAELESKN